MIHSLWLSLTALDNLVDKSGQALYGKPKRLIHIDILVFAYFLSSSW